MRKERKVRKKKREMIRIIIFIKDYKPLPILLTVVINVRVKIFNWL